MTDFTDFIATRNGFKRKGEVNSCAAVDKKQSFSGIDLVPSNIMPDGWVGLRAEGGVLCVGPNGSHFVPAIKLEDILNRPLTTMIEEN